MVNGQFEWVDFYDEFANKLLQFKAKRKELLKIIDRVYVRTQLRLAKLEDGGKPFDIDPFTVFSLFNKGLTDEHRIALLKTFADELHITKPTPNSFDGIPIMNNQMSAFYWFGSARGKYDIDNLWALFDAALNYADSPSSTNKTTFVSAYDQVLSQKGVKWNITMGLFWIRSRSFINLDSRNRWFIEQPGSLPHKLITDAAPWLSKKTVPTGEQYLDFISSCLQSLRTKDSTITSFPELSYEAFLLSRQVNDQETQQSEDQDVTGEENGFSQSEEAHQPYTKTNFLTEVFITNDIYDDIVRTLDRKKNIILEGAPGVGKTYAARRLAYSIMGTKDSSRIKMVQFHQSYSYEDFIVGYRPTDKGFELRYGAFYSLCKQASLDANHKYFFIIDEINRGNLDRIFGELFMLIEADKRGGDGIQLLYSDEMFSVPNNLYIIGLMNTADRSLAMLDYALRRRFAFIELEPGFSTDGFKLYEASLRNKHFDELIACVRQLNDAIAADDSLGKGFRIGHSFFCNLNPISAEESLSEIVNYEIVPLIREYWFDETEKAEKWAADLRKVLQ